MRILVTIALTGGAGAACRFLLDRGVRSACGDAFPYSTFAVNLLGCLAFGVLFGLGQSRWPELARAAVFTGFLGGFTTFSSYAFECAVLLQNERWLAAAANVLGQNALGIAGVLAGIWLTR
jgi:CrcB protein